MEDQDKIQSDEDVEAHKKKNAKATDEGSEQGSDDDFELHKRRNATDEGGDDEDFELHRKNKLTK